MCSSVPSGRAEIDAAPDDRRASRGPAGSVLNRRHGAPTCSSSSRHRHGVPELMLLSTHTGREKHAYGPQGANRAEGKIASAVADVAACRVSRSPHRRPAAALGRQRQAGRMGRAIVRVAEGVPDDEPLSNLDASSACRLRTSLSHLHRASRRPSKSRTTNRAMTLGHRVAVMHPAGSCRWTPPTPRRPHRADLFVAGFIVLARDDLVERSIDGETRLRAVSRPRGLHRRRACRGPGRPQFASEAFEDAALCVRRAPAALRAGGVSRGAGSRPHVFSAPRRRRAAPRPRR